MQNSENPVSLQRMQQQETERLEVLERQVQALTEALCAIGAITANLRQFENANTSPDVRDSRGQSPRQPPPKPTFFVAVDTYNATLDLGKALVNSLAKEYPNFDLCFESSSLLARNGISPVAKICCLFTATDRPEAAVLKKLQKEQTGGEPLALVLMRYGDNDEAFVGWNPTPEEVPWSKIGDHPLNVGLLFERAQGVVKLANTERNAVRISSLHAALASLPLKS